MKFIIWYVAIGLTALCLTFGMHLLRSELKGYEACDWWAAFMPALIDTYESKELITLCLRIIAVWPLCVVVLYKQLPGFYGEYRLKWSKRRRVSR